jgi:hypothetical protein
MKYFSCGLYVYNGRTYKPDIVRHEWNHNLDVALLSMRLVHNVDLYDSLNVVYTLPNVLQKTLTEGDIAVHCCRALKDMLGDEGYIEFNDVAERDRVWEKYVAKKARPDVFIQPAQAQKWMEWSNEYDAKKEYTANRSDTVGSSVFNPNSTKLSF